MHPPRRTANVERYFAGLTEFAFQSRMGVCDPHLTNYVARLLTRFLRTDAVYAIRGLSGRRLDAVAEMLAEAHHRIGESRRTIHRHIGDFTLFWTGLYPEVLPKLQHEDRVDHLLDYSEQGKRSYEIASRMRTDDNRGECEVLERLSQQFEVCVRGLSEVRREWERRDDVPPETSNLSLWLN